MKYVVKLDSDPNHDNSPLLQSMIDQAKDGDTLDFSGLDGDYTFIKPIVQNNKGLRWINEYGNFRFRFYGKGNAVTFTRDQGTQRNYLKRINFIDGYNHPKEDRTGLYIEIPTTLDECQVLNFYRCVWFTGNADRKTDASYSKVFDCNFSGATGPEAVLCQGGDANHIGFERNDFRDCLGIGLHDDSFLGCEGYGNGFHNCAGGAIKQTQAAASGYYDQCYMEEDNGASQVIHGRISGFIGSKVNVYGEGDFVRGSRHSRITVGPFEFIEAYTSANGDQFPDMIRFAGKEFSTSEPQLVNVQTAVKAADGSVKYPSYAHYQLQHLGQQIFDFWGSWKDFPSDYRGMKIPFAAMAVPHLFIGTRLHVAMSPEKLKGSIYETYFFRPGDVLENPDFNPGAEANVIDWVCVKGGLGYSEAPGKAAVWQKRTL
jgi:hypothetical protein